MSDVREKRTVDEDQAKLLFEFFKHLSTLDVASALAILAIYREAAVESFVVWTALALFGASLVLSVILLFYIAWGTRNWLFLSICGLAAGYFMILGVLGVGLFATGFDEYIKNPIFAGFVLILSVINLVWVRKRARKRAQQFPISENAE